MLSGMSRPILQGVRMLRVAITLVAGSALVLAQPPSPRQRDPIETIEGVGRPRTEAREIVLEGFVLASDGAPAKGAVVVSSAGGRAVTDAAGNYQLRVDVPQEATSVQITVLGCSGGNLSASTSVAVRTGIGAAPVSPLQLVGGGLCTPRWIPTFGGSPGTNSDVFALAVYDDGGGPELYAGGQFTTAGGATVNRLAKWNGQRWSALGSGLNGSVLALAVFDDGSGAALYVGGSFTQAGGGTANRVARWDGSSWSALPGLTDGAVNALAVYDDGGGPALYVGTSLASPATGGRVVKWYGSGWTTLGIGMNDKVMALAVLDHGSGPALHAGGYFTTAGGAPANGIAKWDGTSWSALGSGVNGLVLALAVYDDGGGPALYAGGSFTIAGGIVARRVAKWNGTSWSALRSALYAGGYFLSAGGVAANRIAKWDGASWSAIGSGVSGSSANVHALVVHDDGTDQALFVGGGFSIAAESGDSYLAKWGCFDELPVLSCPPVNVIDRSADGPGEVVFFTVTATDDLDPAPVVVCVPPSGSTFPRGTTLVSCTATDASGNQSTCQFPVTVTLKLDQRER